MALVFRLATEHDIPSLNQLIPESVRALSVGYYSERQIESALLHIFGVDSQLIADRTYFVAVADDQVVGGGGWSQRKTLFGGDQIKTAEDNLLDPAQDAARIRAFFVHPNWARQGIGRSIIERCEGRCAKRGISEDGAERDAAWRTAIYCAGLPRDKPFRYCDVRRHKPAGSAYGEIVPLATSAGRIAERASAV